MMTIVRMDGRILILCRVSVDSCNGCVYWVRVFGLLSCARLSAGARTRMLSDILIFLEIDVWRHNQVAAAVRVVPASGGAIVMAGPLVVSFEDAGPAGFKAVVIFG